MFADSYLHRATFCCGLHEEIYKASFVPVPFTALAQNIRDQIQNGTVLFSPCTSLPSARGWISMPMPLLCTAIEAATQDAYTWMKRLCHFSEIDPTKQFEFCVFASEQVKSLMKLPMLPSLGTGTLNVTPPHHGPSGVEEQKSYDWSTLKIISDATTTIGDGQIFQQRGAEILMHQKYKLKDKQMIICAGNHAYVEGQLFGTVEGMPIKVLFQSKINKNIEDSVRGLNEAADLISHAGWTGLFLYLIVLGEERELGTFHNHPTLLVTPQHYNEFFSPSFALTLEVQHQIFSEKPAKKQKT